MTHISINRTAPTFTDIKYATPKEHNADQALKAFISSQRQMPERFAEILSKNILDLL